MARGCILHDFTLLQLFILFYEPRYDFLGKCLCTSKQCVFCCWWEECFISGNWVLSVDWIHVPFLLDFLSTRYILGIFILLYWKENVEISPVFRNKTSKLLLGLFLLSLWSHYLASLQLSVNLWLRSGNGIWADVMYVIS